MEKRPQHVTPSKQRSGLTPARKHVPRSRLLKAMQKRIMPFNQSETILEALPDSVIACDREGKILRINAAARKLFEVSSEALLKLC
jgi:PAS domain-containing protein